MHSVASVVRLSGGFLVVLFVAACAPVLQQADIVPARGASATDPAASVSLGNITLGYRPPNPLSGSVYVAALATKAPRRYLVYRTRMSRDQYGC